MAGVALAQESEGAPPSAVRQHNLAVSVLRQHVDIAEFQDQTFEEVLDWIRDQGPINVVAQWRALEAEGIGPDNFISLELRDTTVGDVLIEAVDQLSDVSPVLFRASGNTVKISTKADFDRKMELRVYNVTDLLIRIKNFTESPRIDIEQASQGGQQGGQQPLFSGGGGQEQDDDEDDRQLDEDDPGLVKLREVIEDTIEPEAWDTYGGKASIRPWDRSLIVTAPLEIHEKINGAFVR
ncbi:MAG: hypothetical protein C4547_08270 [Phycisphaerales bacterium]|nr:MAG: hypothetical protein C4547_08270 [Phycisphaerales bacterium]